MIALGLDGPEELAEAYFLAEMTAAALAFGQPSRGNLWRDLDPEVRAIKVRAAARLITLYRIEGMTLESGVLEAS